MKELAEVKFRRCVIPDDAESTDIETLEFGDSSEALICAAVYARVKRVTGSYSCQYSPDPKYCLRGRQFQGES